MQFCAITTNRGEYWGFKKLYFLSRYFNTHNLFIINGTNCPRNTMYTLNVCILQYLTKKVCFKIFGEVKIQKIQTHDLHISN